MEKPLGGHHLNIQAVGLQHTEGLTPSTTAFAVAVVLVVLDRLVAAGTVIFGDITLGEVTLATMRLAVCLQAVAEQGARCVLIPIVSAG